MMYRLVMAALAAACMFQLIDAAGSKSNRRRDAEQLKAIAVISGPNNVKGTINFECVKETGEVHVTGEIRGLSPGDHGFHIHQYGDTSDSCKSMAGHFNPGHQNHGAPQDGTRHVGDLGNIVADQSGVARIDITDGKISLKGSNSIIGRGVVVHGGKDDLGKGSTPDSRKTGNAGPRVGCGIVALTKGK